MQNIDIIDRLPHELKNCLITDKFFCDIPVVVVEDGNLKDEIARAQGVINDASGKRGVAVLVLQVVADDESNSLQFGPMILRPAFQVIENVELNRDENGTKKSARKVARKIRDVIKSQYFIGLVQDMRTAKPCIEPVDLKDLGDAIRSYQANFECREVGLQTITAVQMPAISLGSSPPQFILSSGTAGAAIWFTLDDSFPFNGTADVYPDSTAQLFVSGSPVNIPAGGCWLRARAYLDGETNINSPINRAFLPN